MATPARVETDHQPRYIQFGQARWDRATRRLLVRELPVKLPWRVVECLSILIDASGAVVSKDDLESQIWGGAMVEYSNVAQCITALRKALDPAPDGGSYIETVARVGYRLAVPIVVQEETPIPQDAPAPPWRRPLLHRLAFGLPALAAILALSLIAYQRLDRRRQADSLIERGLLLLRRSDPNDAPKANALFQQANDLLPGYPLAQSAIAEFAARQGNLTFDNSLDLARRAASAAPSCAECQAIAGFVLMSRAWKWAEAEAHLRRATELNPNNPTHRIWYAEWLSVNGRLPEALAHAQAAVRLAPAEPRAHNILALVHFLSSRYPDALLASRNAVALDPRFRPAHYWMYRTYLQTGDDTGAIFARSRFLTVHHDRYEQEFERVNGDYSHLYSTAGGRDAVARSWLKQFDSGPSREIQRYARAVWFMWIGDRENAIAELQAAVRSKPYHLIFVAVDPAFHSLRGDPRFREVVRAVGLSPPA